MKTRIALATFFFVQAAYAEVTSQTIEYKDGEAVLEGYLAYDTSAKGNKRPGILVVHEWMGLGDYAKKRADQLAAEGYVAFAADIYGKGIRPTTPREAGELAGRYKANRPLLRSRVLAGLNTLRSTNLATNENVAAIGYCFGGTAVLELARAGADVKGVVSFHGGLDSPTQTPPDTIKAKVLVLHGADDPNVPQRDVDAFAQEMRNAKADWQFHAYGGAVHSFTNPAAGNDPSTGNAYNAVADRRSWEEMKTFFAEILK